MAPNRCGRKFAGVVQLSPDALTLPRLGDNFCRATHFWGIVTVLVLGAILWSPVGGGRVGL